MKWSNTAKWDRDKQPNSNHMMTMIVNVRGALLYCHPQYCNYAKKKLHSLSPPISGKNPSKVKIGESLGSITSAHLQFFLVMWSTLNVSSTHVSRFLHYSNNNNNIITTINVICVLGQFSNYDDGANYLRANYEPHLNETVANVTEN